MHATLYGCMATYVIKNHMIFLGTASAFAGQRLTMPEDAVVLDFTAWHFVLSVHAPLWISCWALSDHLITFFVTRRSSCTLLDLPLSWSSSSSPVYYARALVDCSLVWNLIVAVMSDWQYVCADANHTSGWNLSDLAMLTSTVCPTVLPSPSTALLAGCNLLIWIRAMQKIM